MKTARTDYPEIASCIDDLRNMGFKIEGVQVRDEDDNVVVEGGRMDEGGVWLPAERVLAMQAYARTILPSLPKMESKTATSKRGKKK